MQPLTHRDGFGPPTKWLTAQNYCFYVFRFGYNYLGRPTAEQQATFDLNVKALESTIVKAKAGVEMIELKQIMHGIFKAAGHGAYVFGPPIHGVGIEFEESPLPPGHAFFHGPPLVANVVIAIGKWGFTSVAGACGRKAALWLALKDLLFLQMMWVDYYCTIIKIIKNCQRLI